MTTRAAIVRTVGARSKRVSGIACRSGNASSHTQTPVERPLRRANSAITTRPTKSTTNINAMNDGS
jgi:hypothetical protein